MASFLERLQASDPSTKRRVIFAASALAGAAVLVLWLGYFNTIVTRLPMPQTSPEEIPAERAATPTFFETIGRGAAVVRDALRGFFGPREYRITP